MKYFIVHTILKLCHINQNLDSVGEDVITFLHTRLNTYKSFDLDSYSGQESTTLQYP